MDKYKNNAKKRQVIHTQERNCRCCSSVFTISNGAQVNCFDCIDKYGIGTLKDTWRKYGITCKQVEDIYDSQFGKCPICLKGIELWGDRPKEVMQSACIDHCHSTGKIRGLLCQHCNRGLGLFFDKPYALRNASYYLEDNNG